MLIKTPNNRLHWTKVDYPEIGQIYCTEICDDLYYPYAFVRVSEDMVMSLNKKNRKFNKTLAIFRDETSSYWVLQGSMLNVGKYFKVDKDG